MAFPHTSRRFVALVMLAALGVLAALLTACDIPFLGDGEGETAGEATPAPASPITASDGMTGTLTTTPDEPAPTTGGPTVSPAPETPVTPAPESTVLPTPLPTALTASPSESDTPSVSPLADLAGQTLIVGSDTAYPPMEYVERETKRIVGFDIDLMYAIGAQLNATIEFRSFRDFDHILAALNRGDFDLVVSGVAVTTERTQVVDFSRPYLEVGQVVVVSAEQTGIAGVEDLPNARLVGVQQDTVGEAVARQAGVDAPRIQPYETIDLAFNGLISGGVDAVVADGPVAAWYVSQHPDLIKVVGEPFRTVQYAIALQQGDTALQEALNGALQELEADGTLQRLLATWHLTEVATIP